MTPIRGFLFLLVMVTATNVLGQKPAKKSEPKTPLSRHVASLYGQALLNSPLMVSQDAAQTTWRVLYVTNRVRFVGEKDQRITYGPVLASPPRLEYGDCEVVIPRRANDAALEVDAKTKPTLRNAGNIESGCRQFQPIAYNRFLEELVNLTSQSPQRDVLIYVHGYNVRFEDAIYRAAQLAQEMPFNGVVICYSWPSAGSSLSYSKDVENSDATVKHLWRFLSAVHSHLGNNTRINLLGHGMGCRALLQGVASLPKNIREARPFQHLVLATPDVPSEKFPLWADRCTLAARHVTLYASKDDDAVLAAKNYARQVPSAGDATKLLIVPQIDTIDVSLVNRNFFTAADYRSHRSIMNELFQLVKLDNPPAQRPWLRTAKSEGKVYWQFVDQAIDAVTAERQSLKK